MLRHFRRDLIASGLAIATLMVAAPAYGQDSPNTISITGRGKVKVAPTSVELFGMINIEAELAGDALTKFRSAKQSTVDAIQKLGIENLTVETSGFAIGPSSMNESTTQMILNRSRGGAAEPPKILLHESVRMRLKQIDKMDREKLLDSLIKIIDAAKESGVTFGPPAGARISITREENQGFVTFMLDDAQPLREQAEAQAMQDARTKAERLAKLAGSQLGEIRSVREVARSTELLSSGLRATAPEQSAKLEEIEVSISLQVDFRLVDKKPAAE